jgi:hypothetical protein
MRDHRLSHFNLRYDGDAHDDVGREILRALERHYATLATTFDHTPATSIPVILFTSQRYHDASGAPAWAGGSYDSLDGRIRIPIAGLTRDLTPDINDVLLHELTHVFVWEMSGGIAPRQVQEGLAQYTEGKRVESQLTPEQVTALADGRVRGVSGFYIASLSFVEYLVAQRGQSGINDLLKAMRERGNADQAFNDVYGQSLSGLMEAWSNRMRLRHGS